MKNKGQNLVEHNLIFVCVAVLGILALTLFGGNVKTMFTKTNEKAKEYKPFDFAANNGQGSSVGVEVAGSASQTKESWI